MNAIRNSYFFSRVAILLSAGSNPSVTIAKATFQVDELAYRTCPARHTLVSRHISRVDDVETIQVDRPMLDRIRRAITRLSEAIRAEEDEYLRRDEAGSHWFFQPRQDGWFAMFNGRARDTDAFHRWLVDILT